jgi:hypothetical protein
MTGGAVLEKLSQKHEAQSLKDPANKREEASGFRGTFD